MRQLFRVPWPAPLLLFGTASALRAQDTAPAGPRAAQGDDKKAKKFIRLLRAGDGSPGAPHDHRSQQADHDHDPAA